MPTRNEHEINSKQYSIRVKCKQHPTPTFTFELTDSQSLWSETVTVDELLARYAEYNVLPSISEDHRNNLIQAIGDVQKIKNPLLREQSDGEMKLFVDYSLHFQVEFYWNLKKCESRSTSN